MILKKEKEGILDYTINSYSRTHNKLSKNISFFYALKRIIEKLLLRWLSLLMVSGVKKERAIHDHVAKSVVKPYSKKQEQYQLKNMLNNYS